MVDGGQFTDTSTGSVGSKVTNPATRTASRQMKVSIFNKFNGDRRPALYSARSFVSL